jgi:hypothetical protein
MPWIVCENQPGCLPESVPERYPWRGDAVARAMELKEELREQGYKVSGNMDSLLEYYATRHNNDPGRVVTVRYTSRSPEEDEERWSKQPASNA